MEVLELLERIGRVEPPGDAVLDRAMGRIAPGAIGADGSIRGGGDRRARRQLGRRTLLEVVAAAVIVAAALVATGLARTGSSTAAAAELRHLATVADTQPPGAVPGLGEYLCSESVSLSRVTTSYPRSVGEDGRSAGAAHVYTYVQTDETRFWTSPDRDGLVIEALGSPSFLTSADRAAWQRDGSPSLTTGEWATALGPDPLLAQIPTLPTDPVALGEEIADRDVEGGPPGPAEDFVQVGDLLRESDASPQLRAALFEYAASLPGIVLLGSVTDHSGRAGVGLGYVTNGLRTDLVFDASTSALLGEDEVVVGSDPQLGLPVGSEVSWTVYGSSSVVSTLPSTTGMRQGPPTGSAVQTLLPRPSTG